MTADFPALFNGHCYTDVHCVRSTLLGVQRNLREIAAKPVQRPSEQRDEPLNREYSVNELCTSPV